MFGKKLLKGYLVARDGTLLKEFVFNPKVEVYFDDVKKVIEGKGDLAALGAFEVERHVGTVVKGSKMHFIIISRDVVEDEETKFFSEMLNSVDGALDAAMEGKIAKAKEAEDAAKAEQAKAKAAMDTVFAEREEIVSEAGEMDLLGPSWRTSEPRHRNGRTS